MRSINLMDAAVRDNRRFFAHSRSDFEFYQTDTDGRVFMVEVQSCSVCLVREVMVTVNGRHLVRVANPTQLDSIEDARAYIKIFDDFDTTTPAFPTNAPESSPELAHSELLATA